MGKLKITIIILSCVIALSALGQDEKSVEDYSPAERELVDEFMTRVDEARDRLDRLQENSPLYGKKYIDQDKTVIEAAQMAGLIEDGHYVDPDKLREWNDVLADIADAYLPSKSYDESVSRYDEVMKRGEDVVNSSRQKIQAAREKLEKEKKEGVITNEQYNSRLKRIENVEKY